MKTALTIGGSDSSGGAGIQADLKTFTVLNVYGMSAITAVTAQNTLGVKKSVEMDPEFVRLQIDTAAGDIPADATKTGMLSSASIVEVVEDSLKRNKLAPYVCDPVIMTKSGDTLLKDDAINALTTRLFPLAAVVTPNLGETAKLTGASKLEPTIATAKDAAKRLIGLGAKAVLIKGIEQGDSFIDLFYDGHEFLEYAGKTMPKEKTHGAGCALSAAIAAGLANRLNLVDAIDQAKQLVTAAIQYGDGQGRGNTPVNVLSFAPKVKK